MDRGSAKVLADFLILWSWFASIYCFSEALVVIPTPAYIIRTSWLHKMLFAHLVLIFFRRPVLTAP